MPCIFFSQNEFALINSEKSSTKESERKETKAEEDLDTEVLEVFHPTQDWQALQPGTRLSPVPLKYTLNSNCVCPLSLQGYSSSHSLDCWKGTVWSIRVVAAVAVGLGIFFFLQNRVCSI